MKIILLDADVIIHFIKAGKQLDLSRIYPKHQLHILDKVYDELKKYHSTKTIVDNLFQFKMVTKEDFPTDFQTLKEYAILIKEGRGDGESACMAVARFKKNIIASSNLKDIKTYCEDHSISYLTTMDFLCNALKIGVYTETECDNFIATVKSKGSKLPVNYMSEYICRNLE